MYQVPGKAFMRQESGICESQTIFSLFAGGGKPLDTPVFGRTEVRDEISRESLQIWLPRKLLREEDHRDTCRKYSQVDRRMTTSLAGTEANHAAVKVKPRTARQPS